MPNDGDGLSQVDVARAANLSVDELGRCAAKTRKMRRRARTREEDQKLREKWLEQIDLLKQAADRNLQTFNDSAAMARAIQTLDGVQNDLADARRKMTTAAKAIDQATRVVNLASNLLVFFV